MTISDRIVVFLKNYPGRNDDEFRTLVESQAARDEVRAILDETMRIQMDWTGKSLDDIGDEVERVMHARHPDLTDAALDSLANYFTYLVK
ncbi:MAG TPA: hypothetical protein VN035_12235 [Microbacterium sp.]|nr:hypothetical protein [Microbacterium sp.]